MIAAEWFALCGISHGMVCGVAAFSECISACAHGGCNRRMFGILMGRSLMRTRIPMHYIKFRKHHAGNSDYIEEFFDAMTKKIKILIFVYYFKVH